MVLPVLIIAIGNESRGDDALAPLLVRRLSFVIPGNVEIFEEFQLQIEHVTDLLGRKAVLFVDADVSCDAPFHFSTITAEQDNSYTTHAITPFALLHTYRQVYGTNAPTSYLLRIRGYGFELGTSLSSQARDNLEQAARMICAWLADIRTLRE
jgi:hydrogenase maturation protease